MASKVKPHRHKLSKTQKESKLPLIVTHFINQYKSEPDPEHWHRFPEFMWKIGFEMDCYKSAPRFEPLDNTKHTEQEVQDYLLWHMPDWSTQQVGNYIFSRYRELTHWSDYGYPKEKGHYFFERAFPILEEKLEEEWEIRNTMPSFEEFCELVIERFRVAVSHDMINAMWAYASSEYAQYCLKRLYDGCKIDLEDNEITIPMLRGRCVTDTALFLEDAYITGKMEEI